jgi:hypothetical protein
MIQAGATGIRVEEEKEEEEEEAIVLHLDYIFGIMTPCRLVGPYKSFRGTCCLHLQGGNITSHY